MQLMMFIGNDLIESVSLEAEMISKPGYVGNFKRSLKEKYQHLILENKTAPEFLVIEPSPVIKKEKPN